MLKRTAILSFFLAIVLGLSSLSAVAAQRNEKICAEMETLHRQALSLYKKNTGNASFYGNCGIYVGYLLHALNIDDYLLGHNGNQWYSAFKENEKMQNGYTAMKFSGANCLYDLAAEYGDVSYILVSFPHQTGYSYENPGAGHVVFINRIEDGNVYFTESYAMYDDSEGRVGEGEAHMLSLDRLMQLYSSWYGDPIGAVWFSDGQPPLATESLSAEVTAERLSAVQSLPYRVDLTASIISNIPGKTTVSALNAKLPAVVSAVTVESANGECAAEEATIATGMRLRIKENDAETVFSLAVKGDADGDGQINSADARLVLRKAAGLATENFSETEFRAADVNADNKVTSSDARIILRSAAKLDVL